jgi:hypothetical protein
MADTKISWEFHLSWEFLRREESIAGILGNIDVTFLVRKTQDEIFVLDFNVTFCGQSPFRHSK